MKFLNKLGAIGLVVASSIIINTGYFATNLYKIPGIITVIIIPSILVMCIGWFQRSIKRTMLLTFGLIFLSGALLQITLSAPIFFGLIQDKVYRQLFVYSAFMRVGRYMILTAFFSLLTALIAGLAFE